MAFVSLLGEDVLTAVQEGADFVTALNQQCQNDASAAGLPSDWTFVALVATNDSSIVHKITAGDIPVTSPFVLPDGTLLITGTDELLFGGGPFADDFNMLANGTRLHSTLGQFYVSITGIYNASAALNCHNWTTLDTDSYVSYGAIDQSGTDGLFGSYTSPWLHVGRAKCNLGDIPWPNEAESIVVLKPVVFCTSNSFGEAPPEPSFYQAFLDVFGPWITLESDEEGGPT
jgi:hypothetical protein